MVIAPKINKERGIRGLLYMSETSEEAVLLALETRKELFDSLFDMLTSENYAKVLMGVEEGMTQGEIAEAVGVGSSTVSRAMEELEEFDLVEEIDDGWQKSLPVLDHPMIQYYFEKEVLESD